MSGFVKRLAHVFFPERCLFCGEVIREGEVFCKDCAEDIRQPLHPAVCANCKAPFEECCCDLKTVAVYYYEEGAAEAIRRMKFHGERLCAGQLAQIMAEHLRLQYPGEFDGIIPLPLHWRDRMIRGYSQTVWLAKALSKELGVAYEPKILRKTRHTKKQHDLSQKERKRNLRDAFSCKHGGSLSGKRILLLDDVTTTGSTFREAVHTLKEAGVEEIVCLAAAKTRFTE